MAFNGGKCKNGKIRTNYTDLCAICWGFQILGEHCWESSSRAWQRDRIFFVSGLKPDLFREEIWDATGSHGLIKSWIIYISRHLGDNRSSKKGGCEERKERCTLFAWCLQEDSWYQGLWRVGSIYSEITRKLDHCSRYEECGVLPLSQEGPLCC